MICTSLARRKLPTRQAGLSLLETMLAIAVISIIMIFIVQRYSQYQIKANAAQIEGSAEVLFDMMNRYYLVKCRDLDSVRSSGDWSAVSAGDLVDAGIIASEQALNLVIKDPYNATNPLANYSMLIKYFPTDTNSGLASPGSDAPAPQTYYWKGSAQYHAVDAGLTTDRKINTFGALMNVTDIDTSNLQFKWRHALTTGQRELSSKFSPITEDLERFSVQQYVPNSAVSSSSAQQQFDQDYDSTFQPSNTVDTVSCEVYEEQYANSNLFLQRRGID